MQTTLSTNSPTATSSSVSEASSTTPPIPLAGSFFNVLAMVAEFEADLIRAQTWEGMAVAETKGRLRGRQPKLSKAQETRLVSVHLAGTRTTVELAELFEVAR